MFDYYNYYYLIAALESFCLYHAYRNRNEQKWYWLIIFLPVIGSLIYLYVHFYSRRGVHSLREGVKGLIYSNYQVDKLEKAVKFSETFTNKTNLADAYTERGRYEEAITLYESCKKGIYENNEDLINKLAKAYFLNKNYQKVIDLNKQVELINEQKIMYAWALYYTGDSDSADKAFKQLERRYSNYEARIEYGYFLMETNKNAEAKSLLEGILDEFDNSHSYEKNHNKAVINEAKKMLKMIK